MRCYENRLQVVIFVSRHQTIIVREYLSTGGAFPACRCDRQHIAGDAGFIDDESPVTSITLIPIIDFVVVVL